MVSVVVLCSVNVYPSASVLSVFLRARPCPPALSRSLSSLYALAFSGDSTPGRVEAAGLGRLGQALGPLGASGTPISPG